MEQFVGAAGGLLMAVLVAALLMRFLDEMGILPHKHKLSGLLIIAGTGLAELLVCGIYYTVRVPGTSLLDIPQIFEGKMLFLMNLWPFNWYMAMACGSFALWNFFQTSEKLWDVTVSKKLLFLLFAIPGVYVLFLPTGISLLVAVFSLVLRRIVGTTINVKESSVLHRIEVWFDSPAYCVSLGVLAVINGVTVILILGI